VVYAHVPPSPSSIIWYQPTEGNDRWLGRQLRTLGKVMTAYRQAGFGHLRADCRRPGSAPKLCSFRVRDNILLVTKLHYQRLSYYIIFFVCRELLHYVDFNDLSITVTDDLKSRAHINIIVTKAHQRANAILRCFLSGNIDMLKRAFLTYVRPLVEYNSVVWSPCYKQDIEAIERVRRRFSKRLPGLKNLSYEERLKYLGWPTLELRRLCTDLIWCYKILFGLVHLNADHLFQL